MTRVEKTRLGAALLATLALRLSLWAHLARDPKKLLVPDSPSYEIPALNLVEGRGFSGSIRPPFEPETFRTPGYPLFLAAHRLGSPSDRWPALSQSLLETGTALLAAACAALLAPGPGAWLAAAFYGLEPMAVAHAPLILSEPLFSFSFMLSLFLLLSAGPEGRAGPAAGAGLCLGFAALTRPIACYLPLPLGIALCWPWRRRPRALAVFLLSAALLPALWCARNKRLFGRFSMSTVPGINLLEYDAAAVRAAVAGEAPPLAKRELMERFEAQSPPGAGPFERSDLKASFARREIKGHIGALLRVHVVSGFKMLAGPGVDLLASELYDDATSGEGRSDVMTGRGTLALLARHPTLWAVVLFETLLLAAVYLFGARGAFRIARRGGFWAAAWLAPLVYLAALSTGGWAYYRFRVPLWPLFSALAAVGAALPPTKRETAAHASKIMPPINGRR